MAISAHLLTLKHENSYRSVAYLGFHFGGGFKFFLEKWGYLHAWREAACSAWQSHAFARGGSGACSPEKIFKNGAIWCVLESILLKFCQKII